MAEDNELEEGPERYYVYREYPVRPFRRYALTITASSEAPYYGVEDVQPEVADALWLEDLRQHLAAPAFVQTGFEEDGVIYEVPGMAHPGQEMHLAGGVRTIRGAGLGPAPGGELRW